MGPGTVPAGAGLTPDWHPSPNFGPRRDGARPDMVVLHYTAMASCEAARDRLCDPAAEVSAHYLVGPDGRVIHMVQEDQRAWHAGAGAWGPVRDVNSRSIGIELSNDGTSPFAAAQMDALERLLPGILARHGIPPARVIGHSDMAPGRKVDPGPRFDWARLARRGLAISVTPEGGDMDDSAFAAAMAQADYTATEDPGTLLCALRLRHRPWATGPRDATDAGLARALARRFGVDGAKAGA
ncbi:N-acetylmuramoyl-L-alanine amidase [Palleronia pelagia]|nr:N-acetylmuramoyl-L-alanine amidase [Palleronia pelagia]